MHTERQALWEETNAALAAVLTADQPAAWPKRQKDNTKKNE